MIIALIIKIFLCCPLAVLNVGITLLEAFTFSGDVLTYSLNFFQIPTPMNFLYFVNFRVFVHFFSRGSIYFSCIDVCNPAPWQSFQTPSQCWRPLLFCPVTLASLHVCLSFRLWNSVSLPWGLPPLCICFVCSQHFIPVFVVNDHFPAPPAVAEPQEIDLIYQVLKQAGEISSSRSGGPTRALTPVPPGNYHNVPAEGTVPPAKQLEQANGTPSVANLHRRSGPTQQQPLLLRGATSSLTVGPVPHASISGVFVPYMSLCRSCSLDVCVNVHFPCFRSLIVFVSGLTREKLNYVTYLSVD